MKGHHKHTFVYHVIRAYFGQHDNLGRAVRRVVVGREVGNAAQPGQSADTKLGEVKRICASITQLRRLSCFSSFIGCNLTEAQAS